MRRFSLLGLMIIIAVISIIICCNARNAQIVALLNGDEQVSVIEFVVTGQQRKVTCDDIVTTKYLTDMLRNSSSTTKNYGGYQSGDIHTYHIRLRLSDGGWFEMRAYLNDQGIGTETNVDGMSQLGWPKGFANRRIEFPNPPPSFEDILMFLSEDKYRGKQMTCNIEGIQITALP